MTITVHDPEIAPVAEDMLARWRAIPVAVAVDLAPERQIDPAIRPLLPPGVQPPLFGRAVTARCAPPDFGAVVRALPLVGPGPVLVIDAAGDRVTAMIGDVLGGQLHRQGAAGLVCDGAIRDVNGLAAMAGLAAYSRSITPRGPTSATGGTVNAPVAIGGCTVAPGDLLLGDGDGLVALPPPLLAALIDKAEAKLALEAEWSARLAAGEDARVDLRPAVGSPLRHQHLALADVVGVGDDALLLHHLDELGGLVVADRELALDVEVEHLLSLADDRRPACVAEISAPYDAESDARSDIMRTTVTLDDQLLDRAAALTGVRERSVLLREALQALIERESARRLARLGGTEPDLAPAPRRRSPR